MRGVPPGVRMRLAGTADKLTETWNHMLLDLLLALVIVYLVMAILFESFAYPLIIMLSVPVAAAGGVVGLVILNQFVLQNLDMLTLLGFVILIGIVVNNAIPAGAPDAPASAAGPDGAGTRDPRGDPQPDSADLHVHHHQRSRHDAAGAVPRRRIRALSRPGDRGDRRPVPVRRADPHPDPADDGDLRRLFWRDGNPSKASDHSASQGQAAPDPAAAE